VLAVVGVGVVGSSSSKSKDGTFVKLRRRLMVEVMKLTGLESKTHALLEVAAMVNHKTRKYSE